MQLSSLAYILDACASVSTSCASADTGAARRLKPTQRLCDAPTALRRGVRDTAALLARTRTPRQRACSRCARYSSASGAWQGARMDGAALAFLGATSAFLLPGTVPLMGINLQKCWP